MEARRAVDGLEQAAMELYVTQGFEKTTVADIAARVGLTERTFFRHFTDKREVLFSGSANLAELLTEQVLSAPDTAAPIEAVGAALQSAGAVIQERGDWSKQRQAVIAANPSCASASHQAGIVGFGACRGAAGGAASRNHRPVSLPRPVLPL